VNAAWSHRRRGEGGVTGDLGRAVDRAPAWSLAVLAMLSVQVGSAFSTTLFGIVGPAGTAWLRLVAAAFVFVAVGRPRLRSRTRSEMGVAIALGVITGAMSVCFLSAIDRIPLGAAVAIEYLGPFSVAVAGTRRARSLVWPVLAITGVLALTEPWTGAVDPVGILWAASSAVCWALYIVLTARVGGTFEGVDGLAITFPIAALATAAIGAPHVAGNLTWQVLATIAGIALIMPVLPMALEMQALRRLPTSTFGVLMALEPAIGTAVGLAVLAQAPTPIRLTGTGLVVLAGIGASRAARSASAGHAPPITGSVG
jgi:inner membrane transporter RhtA